MAFAFLDKHLNTDVVDIIAMNLHKAHFMGISESIRLALTPIEKALLVHRVDNSIDIIWYLQTKYGAILHTDYYYEWVTIIFHFENDRVLIWHNYVNGNDREMILTDGFVENGRESSKTPMYKIEKFFYGDRYNNIKCHSLADFKEKMKTNTIHNNIPFQFMNFKLFKCENISIDYSYESGKKWIDPEYVCSKFLSIFNRIDHIDYF